MGRKLERKEDSEKSERVSPSYMLVTGNLSVGASTKAKTTYASTSLTIPSRNLREARGFSLNSTRARRCCILYLRSKKRCLESGQYKARKRKLYCNTLSHIVICKYISLVSVTKFTFVIPLYSTPPRPPLHFLSRHVRLSHTSGAPQLPREAAASNAMQLDVSTLKPHLTAGYWTHL